MPPLGSPYSPPADVIAYVEPPMSACGPGQKNNAMYCPMDRSIYYDSEFLEAEFRRGDFAPVLILAHEWGHLAQHQLGIFTSPRYRIQHELQADCFGGAVARFADEVLKVLEPGDVDEGLATLFRMGNPDVPWLDPAAHGSPGDRIDAFVYGFRHSASGCTSPEFTETGGGLFKVFPRDGALEGSLRANVPRVVGEYELVDVQPLPQLMELGATDALLATYRSREGFQVGYLLAAFSSPSASERNFNDMVQSLQAEDGYEIIDRGTIDDDAGQELGKYTHLQGANEVMVVTNGTLLLAVSGPPGHPARFLESYPS